MPPRTLKEFQVQQRFQHCRVHVAPNCRCYRQPPSAAPPPPPPAPLPLLPPLPPPPLPALSPQPSMPLLADPTIILPAVTTATSTAARPHTRVEAKPRTRKRKHGGRPSRVCMGRRGTGSRRRRPELGVAFPTTAFSTTVFPASVPAAILTAISIATPPNFEAVGSNAGGGRGHTTHGACVR